MTDLESLDTKSISDMSADEAIEYLRQIRLSRRTPDKKKSKTTKNKTKQDKAASKITAKDAASLLEILGESK